MTGSSCMFVLFGYLAREFYDVRGVDAIEYALHDQLVAALGRYVILVNDTTTTGITFFVHSYVVIY